MRNIPLLSSTYIVVPLQRYCTPPYPSIMTTVTTTSKPTTYKLQLQTGYGPVYRDVLQTEPRDATDNEIPVIDLSNISSQSLEDRKAIANAVRSAGVNTGFFYIRNHGIDQQIIDRARHQLVTFFNQSTEQKEKVSQKQSKYFNGWRAPRSTNVSHTESIDVKESLAWRYYPEYDPDHPQSIDELDEEVKRWIRGEEFVWDGTSHLSEFKQDVLAYWQACLKLARKLIRIFALSLNLAEDYFDSRTTYPGADGVFNYYPVNTAEELAADSVGIGSHTDLQLFTLLWQDMVGGLQVLNREGQWIKAQPKEGTIVVNIGDFMMRLSNDYFKSTVHRVYNRAPVERISMPFFFGMRPLQSALLPGSNIMTGLNLNCVEGVIATCASEDNPPKYEPMSCGDVS